MKKTCMALSILVAVSVAAFTSVAAKKSGGASDKIYSNDDFRFSLNYPGNWNYDEMEKPKIEADTGIGFSIPIGKMAGIGKMCSVNFAEKPKAGKDSDDPNVTLMVMKYSPQETKGKKEKSEKSGGRESKKSECVIVEQRAATWGGQKANLITQRCPETKKVKIGGKSKKATVWRWTTTVTMKRSTTNDIYNLVGEMLCTTSGEQLCDDLPDKGKTEFNNQLKPARDKMLATTKFRK